MLQSGARRFVATRNIEVGSTARAVSTTTRDPLVSIPWQWARTPPSEEARPVGGKARDCFRVEADRGGRIQESGRAEDNVGRGGNLCRESAWDALDAKHVRLLPAVPEA